MYPPHTPAIVPLNSTYSEYSHFFKHETPPKKDSVIHRKLCKRKWREDPNLRMAKIIQYIQSVHWKRSPPCVFL